MAGDSAGGGLAAVICRLARDAGGPAIAFQLLVCPILDVARESAGRRELKDGYFLDRETIARDLELYCPGADPADPRLSPLLAEDFAGLPPAYIHTGQFDPFGDEGEAYAAKLTRCGHIGAWPQSSRHDPLLLLHAAHDPLRAQGGADHRRRNPVRGAAASAGTPRSEARQAGADPLVKRGIERLISIAEIGIKGIGDPRGIKSLRR